MYSVKFTVEFELWLNNIKNSMTRIRLSKRPDKAQRGNLDDVKLVEEGISEMREHFSSGWRMYYVQKREYAHPHAWWWRQVHTTG